MVVGAIGVSGGPGKLDRAGPRRVPRHLCKEEGMQ
jgi:uncharacterized protein GlcG (DUF336 family)